MKFKINSKCLQKALATVAPAVPSRAILPINECVLIESNDASKSLKFTGTNSNLTIETVAKGGTPDGDIQMCVNFHELRAIAARINDAEVVIEDAKGEIVVTSAGRKWKAGKSIDAVNFSKGRPFQPQWSLPLPADVTYYMNQALKCTEPKSELPYFREVWVNIYDGNLDIASSDGQCVFRHQSGVEAQTAFRGMVNPSFVRAVSELDGDATMESDGISLRVKTEGTVVTVVLSEGDFPKYETFYNTEKDYNLEIDRADILAAVEDVFVYNTVDASPHYVKIMFPKKSLRVNFNQAETNKDYETTVDADHDLKIEKMYFIAAKLKTLLSMFPSTTETVKMAITSHDKIIFIKSDEDPLTMGLNPLAY
jgi:DNA polymerase III sliding clamp (beta) subunit (PCNA family)